MKPILVRLGWAGVGAALMFVLVAVALEDDPMTDDDGTEGSDYEDEPWRDHVPDDED